VNTKSAPQAVNTEATPTRNISQLVFILTLSALSPSTPHSKMGYPLVPFNPHSAPVLAKKRKYSKCLICDRGAAISGMAHPEFSLLVNIYLYPHLKKTGILEIVWFVFSDELGSV
jgi:hypothetical protein